MQALVIEDDEITRAMLCGLLEEWGYQVKSAASGAVAWQLLQRHDAPRLVLLDWELPELDGIDLCRRVRREENGRRFYLLMLTVRENSSDLVEALEAGADDFLAKPCVPEVLRARIGVGERLLGLQDELEYQKKFEGVLEMAGAVCHEMNQPLQGVLSGVEIIQLEMGEDNPLREPVDLILQGTKRMILVTRKLMHLSRYKSIDYVMDGCRIVDIDASAGGDC